MISRFRGTLAALAAGLVLLVALGFIPTAHADSGTGRIVSGDIARTAGKLSLVVYGGGSNEQLIVATGCPHEGVAFWATNASGDFVAYVPAATVMAVNASWNAMFPGGIPSLRALIVRCSQTQVTTTGSPQPPTATSTPTPAPKASCLDTQVFLRLLEQARQADPGDGTQALQARIKSMERALGTEPSRVEFTPGTVIDNPGPGGLAVVLTDTKDDPSLVPTIASGAPGGIQSNWVPFNGFAARANDGKSTTNGWGIWVLYTAAQMHSNGVIIPLCSPLPR